MTLGSVVAHRSFLLSVFTPIETCFSVIKEAIKLCFGMGRIYNRRKLHVKKKRKQDMGCFLKPSWGDLDKEL
jgi:hypothetical protein